MTSGAARSIDAGAEASRAWFFDLYQIRYKIDGTHGACPRPPTGAPAVDELLDSLGFHLVDPKVANVATPYDYNVVMMNPVSIRFRRAEVLDQLKAEAGARHVSSSALAEELIEEGLRSRRHPLIIFRDGPTGRRAALGGGPDVWEVIGGVVGGDVAADLRIDRAVEQFGLSPQQVSAALDYYASFTSEIDDEIASNLKAADDAEAAWRRRQDLLAG